MAWVALFVALGGVASGLPGRNTVDSHDIRKNQVRGQDIRAQAVASSELRDGAVQRADLANSSVSAEQLLDGSVGPGQIGPVPAVRVDTPQEAGCVTQEIANNSSEVLQFSNELYDGGDLHREAGPDCSVETQNRLTAPTNGLYSIVAGVIWSSSQTGTRQISILRTVDEGPAQSVASDSRNPSATGETSQNLATEISLGAGDYVELQATQVGGGSLALGNSLDTYFAMTWIGPRSG